MAKITRSELEKKVRECIERVAAAQSMEINSIEPHHKIVADLGFKSLDVATLAAFLESTFHVDPFAQNIAAVTEIQTVKDICDLYDKCVNGEASDNNPSSKDASEDRIQKRLTKRVRAG